MNPLRPRFTGYASGRLEWAKRSALIWRIRTAPIGTQPVHWEDASRVTAMTRVV
jgi:hypothetical protein